MNNIIYASTDAWNLVTQLGIIAVLLLISNVIKKSITPVRKSLMPVSVIAGFLLLFCRLIADKAGISGVFDSNTMELLVYHCIALGFIAMSLRMNSGKKKDSLTGVKSGAIIVGSYLIQGFTGLLISVALSFTVMPGFFKAAGLLLPMGYGQGPGQANNIGVTYESYGFKGGQSFGLALAAAGYVTACTVGVFVLNFWKKNKTITILKNADSGGEEGDFLREKNEVAASDSIDVLSIQTALILVVYILTYILTKSLTSLLSSKLPGLGEMLNPMLWGFNFIIGSCLAMLLKFLLSKGEKKGIIRHRYQSNYLLTRLSGLFFDIMIVAGIACIEPEALKGLVLPFVLMVIAGSVITWLYLRIVCKKVYKGYYYEGLISMYGMMTGTIGSGILLLREIDPEFKTPAADNLVTGSGSGIVFGAPLLILITMAARSDLMCYLVTLIIVCYFAVLMLFINKTKKTGEK